MPAYLLNLVLYLQWQIIALILAATEVIISPEKSGIVRYARAVFARNAGTSHPYTLLSEQYGMKNFYTESFFSANA